MKTLLILILAGLTSCAAFTRRDAADAGMMLAKASLDLAAQKAAGQKVDVKAAGRQLGLQLVSAISANMAANLSAQDKPQAAAAVQAAGVAAALLLRETPFESAEARQTAMMVTAAAVAAAVEHFNTP